MLVADMNFSASNLLAVAISARVDLYKLSRPDSADDFDIDDQMKPSQSIFKFNDTTSAVSFRPDGGLLAVGESSGKVQVFELKNKYSLRQYPDEHTNVRINAFAWSQTNLKNFVSCANDGNLSMYDI